MLEKSNKLIDKIRGWQSNGAYKILAKTEQQYEFISFVDYQKLCYQLNIDYEKQIPSTGVIAIDYCTRNYDLDRFELHLAGFTFQGSPYHNFKNEEKFIKNLVNKKIVIMNE